MTATAHALVAGTIASKFSDPLTASTLALVSHYIMDSIPHWDFGTNWRARPKKMTGLLALTETTFGIWLSFTLFQKIVPFPLWTLTVMASLFPDWLETPWYIFFAKQNKREPAKSASSFEKLSFGIYKAQNFFHAKAQLPLGILTQMVTVGFFTFLLV